MTAAEELLALLAEGERPVEVPLLIVAAHPDDEVIGLGAGSEGFATLDFLRGQEAYKYLWGATDTPSFRRILHPPAGVLP